MTRPTIAITMGDPAGIGPEVIMKALAKPETRVICNALVIGDANRLRMAGKIVGERLEIDALREADNANFASGTVQCLDLKLVPDDLPFGEMSAAAGEAAYRFIERAVQVVQAGSAQAICTAPLSKEALHAAGHKYPGHTELLAHLTALPEVESAAEVGIVPISGNGWNQNIRIDGQAQQGESKLLSNFNRVGPRYFQTMGTRIVAGRDFNERDTLNSTKVAIVNESYSRRFLAGANPIGRTFRIEEAPGRPEPPYEIIGVVKDSKYQELREEITPLTFLTTSQDETPDRSMQFVLRSPASFAAVTASVKRAVAEVDPSISIVFQNLQAQIRESLILERLMAMLSGFFGFLAGLLATIGLYGVISYSVARRKQEIGIRIALGANRRAVIRLVLGEAAVLLLIGLTAGGALAVLAARTARSMLFGLQPHDPLTLGLAIAILAAVGLAASYLPALRAAAVDPMVALRAE